MTMYDTLSLLPCRVNSWILYARWILGRKIAYVSEDFPTKHEWTD